ncbi:hypothetical protein ETH_00040660 [Eimeria tenella]|uniref:Uncharacterized protein n=1 Tax=Eimeria tenella TaxID=5802 RepID=U6KTL3_EIMTE|nr:hypothetical protein ETH_00040660 [Eimeria tenella]CDJ38845.1 hypothetical protein ETH_00040660 [Eimeria tenella]|eukprot:XP_013229600.1 hypothetical protein ETH_00040660 [Eimeria tenella]
MEGLEATPCSSSSSSSSGSSSRRRSFLLPAATPGPLLMLRGAPGAPRGPRVVMGAPRALLTRPALSSKGPLWRPWGAPEAPLVTAVPLGALLVISVPMGAPLVIAVPLGTPFRGPRGPLRGLRVPQATPPQGPPWGPPRGPL